MLSLIELEDTAKLKRLPITSAEKDYLQEILLFSIYSNVGKELIFKGGTCLYKINKLNRFSEDLDFTLAKKIDIEKLANKILANLMLLNIKGKIKEINKYDREINVRFLLNGPLYRGVKEAQCYIPLNISLREQPVYEPNKINFISLYKEIPNFDIFSMQEKEILAEKIRAIFTRMKPRDVYDSWFLLVKKNIEPDLQLINKKLSLYKIKFNLDEFKNRIEKMKSLFQIDLKNLIISDLPEFDVIKKELLEKFRAWGAR